MKYKFLLILAILFIYASSCEEEVIIEPFNHAEQALKDNDSLVKYFETHFINSEGELEEMTEETTGETLLSDNPNLQNEEVTVNLGGDDITLKLYHIVLNEGSEADAPARVDRAHVKYVGMTLDHDIFDRNDYGAWVDLFSSFIDGWKYGIPHFTRGSKTLLEDATYAYANQGNGYLFIPSGLAYYNTGELANKPLIFKVTLNDVFHTDHDKDGILSMYEVDEDGNYTSFDTDADSLPNFIDDDDDGDGTLTKDENADLDGDGNPSDAMDTNGNGTPDYLDSTTP